MVNPIGVVYDFPDLQTQASKPEDTEIGSIISEVGEPQRISLKGLSFYTYMLRSGYRKRKPIPSHVFGKMICEDFGAVWDYENVPVPAVSSIVLIAPTVSYIQNALINWFVAARFDVTYVIRCDEPLGATHLLEIFVVTLNSNNKLRGIKWKPAAKPCIAVTVPWKFQYTMKTRGTTSSNVRGFDGCTIGIRTLEDNSAENVSKPIGITVHKITHNLELSGLIRDNNSTVSMPGFLNILEAPEANEVMADNTVYNFGAPLQDQMETEDPQAAADQPAPEDVSVEEAGASEPFTPATPEAKAPKPASKAKQPGTVKNQTGAINNRWHLFRTITIEVSSVGQFNSVQFNASTLESEGESIARPFRRNVWVKGGYKNGYQTGYEFKLVSNRAPQVAGCMEVYVGTNGSFNASRVQNFPRTFHKFGGAATQITCIPNAYSYLSSTDALISANRPWVRTETDFPVTLNYKVVSFNTTDQVSTFKVKVFVRSGDLTFQVPKRPLPRTKTVGVMSSRFDEASILALCQILKEVEVFSDQMGEDQELEGAHCANMDPANSPSTRIATLEGDSAPIIAPSGNEEGDMGEAFGESFEAEEIDQDDFWVCAGDFNVSTTEPTVIPINLLAIPDEFGNVGNNVITEKFRRYGHIVPTARGDYGPVIGEYRVVSHLPTNIAANIAHVCIPSDMNLETATRLFGLESLLGLAGSAISSIGGPLLSGAISTIGGLFQNKGGLSGAPAATADKEASSNPPTISGQLPISKVFEFITTLFNQSSSSPPVWPNLLLQLVDLIGTSGNTRVDGSIPVKVYVKMNHCKFERILYDRVDVQDELTQTNSLLLNRVDVATLLQRLALSNNPVHVDLVPRLVGLMARTYTDVSQLNTYMDVLNLRSVDPVTAEEYAQLQTLVSTVRNANTLMGLT